jgi:hypothetical protein
MAQYNDGTVTFVNGSAVVVGASVDFWTASAVKTGDLIKRSGQTAWYNITSVVSASKVTIAPVYAGANASSVDYQITRDFTPIHSMPEVSAGDRDWQDAYTRAIRIADEQIGAYSVVRGATYNISSGSGRFGWAVGWSATPGEVKVANATGSTRQVPAIGVIASDHGTTVNVYYIGPTASYGNLTPSFPAAGGTRYYLNAWFLGSPATPNFTGTFNLTTTPPTLASYIVQFIGTNKSATCFHTQVDQNYIEI